MRSFTKTQMSKWLNVMSSDMTRPVLCGVCFKDKHIVMTDGYTLVALKIETDWKEEYGKDDAYEDLIVPRTAIKDWLSHHTAKESITVEELAKMGRKDIGRYPYWKNLLPSENDISNLTSTTYLNTALMSVACQVFINQPVHFTIYDSKKPIKLATDDGDIALVMPLLK